MKALLNSQYWLNVGRFTAMTLSSMYLLTLFILEPSLVVASDTENAVVSVTVAGAIALSCDGDGGGNGSGETLSLAGITEFGDTGPLNGTVTTGANAVNCTVRTNNAAGYNLAWQVTTGSGGTNTGYMIANNDGSSNEYTIAPFNPFNITTPTAWDGGTTPASTESAWGGRLAQSSDHFSDSPLAWGNDAADGIEKWLMVATGSTVNIAQGTNATDASGDDHQIGFRVEIGADKIQETGTYQATVNFTATTL